MCKKQEKIMEILEHSKCDNILVYTKYFKAKGVVHKENSIKGILTLTNAAICGCGEECDCIDLENKRKIAWLNIFTDEIVAFSACPA